MTVSCITKRLLDIFFLIVLVQMCLNLLIIVIFPNISSQTQWMIFLIVFNIAISVTVYYFRNKCACFQPPSSEDGTQAMESAAEEDKPPEYEEVIEKAPPYECVLMEDAYRTRLTNNDRKKMTITIVNECMEGAASHEIDPDLPTYEEAAAHFMIPED
ncbi:uncharacterized protein [Palaemon carinicauda]|uniref:uncharacterized protein isoform X2 n=1 Tax=Palaemon carinicauda TaxID=392227 RepID=UPI0035B69D6E